MSTSMQFLIDSTMTAIYPYPPPVIVKHNFWYFHDANFFIMIRSIVYGVHRRFFETSPFFQKILNQNEPGHDIPRGTSALLPIPFNDLEPSLFFTFLHHLYYPKLFVGTETDWKNIRKLAIEWELLWVAGFAMLRLLEIRQEHQPPVIRRLIEHTSALGLYRRIERRNRLYEIQIEDDDEEIIIGDETV